jgi:hypothetical protein
MSTGPASDSASEDRILAASDGVQRAIDAVIDALGPVRASLEVVARQRKAATPLPVLVEEHRRTGGVDIRRAAGAALDDYERAFMALRAEIVRELVDEYGYSLSDVARAMDISRQLVARLLASGRSGTTAAR